jgi:hypothetical protein
LEQFRGELRPGIPFPFTEYYPVDTADVPFYAYRTQAYQRFLAGNSPDLSAADVAQYESLLIKAECGKLTKYEIEQLHKLQAENDGRDYATVFANNYASVTTSKVSDDFEKRLHALSNRAVSASLKRNQQ